jgi:hypothetical protein
MKFLLSRSVALLITLHLTCGAGSTWIRDRPGQPVLPPIAPFKTQALAPVAEGALRYSRRTWVAGLTASLFSRGVFALESSEELPGLPPGTHEPTTPEERRFERMIRGNLNHDFKNVRILIGTVPTEEGTTEGLATVAGIPGSSVRLALIANIDWWNSLANLPMQDRERNLQFRLWHEEFHMYCSPDQILWRNSVLRTALKLFYPRWDHLPLEVSKLLYDAVRIQGDIAAHHYAMQNFWRIYHILTGEIVDDANSYIRQQEAGYRKRISTLTTILSNTEKGKGIKNLDGFLTHWLASRPGTIPAKSQKQPKPSTPSQALRRAA